MPCEHVFSLVRKLVDLYPQALQASCQEGLQDVQFTRLLPKPSAADEQLSEALLEAAQPRGQTHLVNHELRADLKEQLVQLWNGLDGV